VLGEAQTAQALETLWSIEREADVKRLYRLLMPAA
jgi:hypothetical protein